LSPRAQAKEIVKTAHPRQATHTPGARLLLATNSGTFTCAHLHSGRCSGPLSCFDMLPIPTPAPARLPRRSDHPVSAASLDPNDVIVRLMRDQAEAAYAVGTLSAPDQLRLATCDEAVRHAFAYAVAKRVRAWLASGEGDFVLLGPFPTTH
jgi:hypothetical protein